MNKLFVVLAAVVITVSSGFAVRPLENTTLYLPSGYDPSVGSNWTRESSGECSGEGAFCSFTFDDGAVGGLSDAQVAALVAQQFNPQTNTSPNQMIENGSHDFLVVVDESNPQPGKK